MVNSKPNIKKTIFDQDTIIRECWGYLLTDEIMRDEPRCHSIMIDAIDKYWKEHQQNIFSGEKSWLLSAPKLNWLQKLFK